MSTINLTSEDLNLLNSKDGMHALLKSKKVNLDKALKVSRYDAELRKSKKN